VTAKIAKLVLMLSSPTDGEILNAARMLGQALKREGLDWHALAKHVENITAPKKQPRQPPPQYRDQVKPGRVHPDIDTDMCRDMIYELGRYVSKNRRNMSIRDTNFIEDMSFRFSNFKGRVTISPAQNDFISSLYDKYINNKR
jgi:hypothetical protein